MAVPSGKFCPSANGWPLLPCGGGKSTFEPPLTHCVGSAVPKLPLASGCSSVSVARDGDGATTTLTELL